MIRKSVTHDELMAALQPLLDLLGVESPMHIFKNPPLTIGGPISGGTVGSVSFAHVAGPGALKPGRPAPQRAEVMVQEDDHDAEVMQYVTVEVV